MPRLPRAFPFLFAAGVVLCSCAAAQADESGYAPPPDTSVTAGPQDVRVDTPDTHVESTPEWVVVCAGEVTVVIGPGACPLSPPAFVPEPAPEPGRSVPDAPVPEPPIVSAPATAATAEPAASESPGPEGPAPEAPPAPEPAEPAEPLTPVEAARVIEAAHQDPLIAADRPTTDTATGVFTPMRTMVLIAVVGAVAAAGAGRAGATRQR